MHAQYMAHVIHMARTWINIGSSGAHKGHTAAQDHKRLPENLDRSRSVSKFSANVSWRLIEVFDLLQPYIRQVSGQEAVWVGASACDRYMKKLTWNLLCLRWHWHSRCFLAVDFSGWLDTTRYHQVGFRQNLEEIHPTGLLDLSKPSRTSKNLRQAKILETNICRTPKKF